MNSSVQNTWLTKFTIGSRSHRILCAAGTMESSQLLFIAETPNWFYYYRDFSSFLSDRARASGMALLKNINLLYEVCLQRSGLPCAWSSFLGRGPSCPTYLGLPSILETASRTIHQSREHGQTTETWFSLQWKHNLGIGVSTVIF